MSTQYHEIPFELSEYKHRLADLKSRMDKAQVDAVLIYEPENSFYLTGFKSLGYSVNYHAVLVPREGDPIIIHTEQEKPSIEGTAWTKRTSLYLEADDPAKHTAELLRLEGLEKSTIGIEERCWFLNVRDYKVITKHVPDATFIDCSNLVSGMRVIKSPAEIEYMRKAAKAAKATMNAAIDAIRDGCSEADVAIAAYAASIGAGSEYHNHPPFISSGPRSGLTHATWSDRRITRGDAVHLEVSGTIQRYTAPLIRTAVVGEPSELIRKVDRVAWEAQKATIAAIRPGVDGRVVDKACYDVIRKSGLDVPYHFTAYSVGIGFPPDWGDHMYYCWRGDENPVGYTDVRAGMTLHTTGPVLYVQDERQNWLLLGYSDTVLVTRDGNEVLTDVDQRLFIR